METAASRLRWARQRRFRTAAQFARASGVSEVTYRAQENGTRGLPKDAAQRYAEALGLDVVWLLWGKGQPPRDAPADLSLAAGGAKRHPMPGTRRGSSSADLPIYATMDHTDSGMVLLDELTDWAARPLPLQNSRDAFAAYVRGDEMAPAYENGDLIFVQPRRPPERERDVLLASEKVRGERHVLLRRLCRWTDQSWHVVRYDTHRSDELSRADWPHAYRVTGKLNR